MKKFLYPLLLLLIAISYTSCQNYETYADKKEAERDAINRFITSEGIQVISESQFKAQGQTTDVSKNQYVFFERNGVYMQIIREGCGDKLEENKQVNILCRFMEKNIMLDSVLIRNDIQAWLTYNGTTYDTSLYVDKMSVKRTGTTITASFITGMMYMFHGSASVPAGWLSSSLSGLFRCFCQRISLLLRDNLCEGSQSPIRIVYSILTYKYDTY